MSAKEGDLRVYWLPQIGLENGFIVTVATAAEGLKIADVLANYDLFQFESRIKPDYCNTGGVKIFEGGEWVFLEDDEQ